MSRTNSIPEPPMLTPHVPVVGAPLTMRELTETLVKYYGLHEGRYDLMVEFHVATGAFGPDPTVPLPGAAFAMSKVGLTPAGEQSIAPVDAAQCNPRVQETPNVLAKKAVAGGPAKGRTKGLK